LDMEKFKKDIASTLQLADQVRAGVVMSHHLTSHPPCVVPRWEGPCVLLYVTSQPPHCCCCCYRGRWCSA
jgi:hypothetical protein